MPEFSYVARDRIGRDVAGTIQADNSALAAGRVREMGYTVERVRAIERPSGGSRLTRRVVESCVYPITYRVPLNDVAIFFRIFGIMLRSRLSFHQALVHMERQTRSPILKGILRDGHAHVAAGGKLSDVLSAYPWVFSETQVEMVRTAEQTGKLDRMLVCLTAYMDRLVHLRTLISPLITTPAMLFEVTLLVLGKPFFTTGIAATALLVLGKYDSVWRYLSDTLLFSLYVWLVLLAAIIVFRVLLLPLPKVKAWYDGIKTARTVPGKWLADMAVARFERSFAVAFSAGLPLSTAIRSAGKASGSFLLDRAAQQASAHCERGVGLSEAFRSTRCFPADFLNTLETGQTTGDVDDLLARDAERLEDIVIHTAQHLVLSLTVATGYTLILIVGLGILMAR